MLSVSTKVQHHALPGQKLIFSLKPVLWGPKNRGKILGRDLAIQTHANTEPNVI